MLVGWSCRLERAVWGWINNEMESKVYWLSDGVGGI
jgi:hypothetical protein